jgi:hypothetical protein
MIIVNHNTKIYLNKFMKKFRNKHKENHNPPSHFLHILFIKMN